MFVFPSDQYDRDKSNPEKINIVPVLSAASEHFKMHDHKGNKN